MPIVVSVQMVILHTITHWGKYGNQPFLVG